MVMTRSPEERYQYTGRTRYHVSIIKMSLVASALRQTRDDPDNRTRISTTPGRPNGALAWLRQIEVPCGSSLCDTSPAQGGLRP